MNDMPPISSAHDPMAMRKASARRQLTGILGVPRDPPPETLASVQSRVADLETKLRSAWQNHYADHPGGRSSSRSSHLPLLMIGRRSKNISLFVRTDLR
jgi:hypothetical protein